MKNVLVLTYWSFRTGLVQAYTLPYVRMIARRLGEGGRVAFVTFEQDGMLLPPEKEAAARKDLAAAGIDWVAYRYRPFGPRAMFSGLVFLLRLAVRCRRDGIEAIHCYCTPAGSFGAALSLLTGIPLVIDSYEPHADGMVEYGAWSPSGAAFRLLFFMEKLQSRRAAAVVAAAPAMRDYARDRYGVEFDRFYCKPACVDLERFRPSAGGAAALRKELGLDGKLVCVYAGKTGGTYLGREIFDFFRVAAARWPGRFKALVLSSDTSERIAALAAEAGLAPNALVHRFVDHEDVPAYLEAADFALTPVKPLPIKRYCAPIKDGEYWAMGLPVVITPGIAADSDLIEEEGIGAVLEGLDDSAYEKALARVSALLESEPREALRARIRAVAVRLRGMDQAERIYADLYGARA